jgi:chemotaxis protein CheX
MNDEVIEAFVESTTTVFKTMLGTEVTYGLACKFIEKPDRSVSGIIGLIGVISGDVVVSLEDPFAISCTGALLGQEPDAINEDVVDAIGELTNMIVGHAKSKLGKYNLSLGLPSVILGKGHRIVFKSDVEPISLPFDSPWGTFSIELGLAVKK